MKGYVKMKLIDNIGVKRKELRNVRPIKCRKLQSSLHNLGKENVYSFMAPGPGVAPFGHLPKMIMPSTSSLVTSSVRA